MTSVGYVVNPWALWLRSGGGCARKNGTDWCTAGRACRDHRSPRWDLGVTSAGYVVNPLAECLTLAGAVKPGCLRCGWCGGLTAPARVKGGLAIGLPPLGWLPSCCGRVRAAQRLRRSRCELKRECNTLT